MKQRILKVWLPGLATGFVAYAAQNVIAHRVAWPRVVHIRDAYLVYSWQWLLVLLFTGALGAAWSRMAGGSLRDRLVAALAPSEIIGILMIGVLPFDFAIQIAIDHRVPYSLTHPVTVLALLTWLVVIPAVPSLLGASWFLRQRGNHFGAPAGATIPS